jgi:hypothetical protein
MPIALLSAEMPSFAASGRCFFSGAWSSAGVLSGTGGFPSGSTGGFGRFLGFAPVAFAGDFALERRLDEAAVF